MRTKDDILAEIRRTAAENGGTPPGRHRFEEMTGISPGVWRGRFWRSWSDAVREAGLAANAPPEPHAHDVLVDRLARLVRLLGRFPTHADMQLERKRDSNFPSHGAFTKLGTKEDRIAMVRALAHLKPEFADVLPLLPADEEPASTPLDESPADGFVYLLKFGKHYKIGRTEAVPNRHRQINLELPEKADLVHTIRTDDAPGIEAYWHRRFAAKRTNGEWFALDRDDVRAFKRRKFM